MPAAAAPPATTHQVEELSDEAKLAAQKNRAGVAREHEVAVFAGGCFWGMQELLRKVPGVVTTDVGYAGRSESDKAESVRVVFDPKRVTYQKLVVYFFKIHDPTTPNRQGNDIGPQYRSAIFYQTPEQGRVARAVKERADRSGKLGGPVTTQIVPTSKFHPAGEAHQDYLQKNPNGYTCHFERSYDII